MKFFATAALIAVASAQCSADGNKVCPVDESKPDVQPKCIQRVTTDVKSTKSSAYKKALKADETLAKDYVFYQCSFPDDVEALIASGGKPDKQGVTFTFTDVTPENVGSGATAIKASVMALAVAAASYL